jgi:hypothetical protein
MGAVPMDENHLDEDQPMVDYATIPNDASHLASLVPNSLRYPSPSQLEPK